MTAKTIVFTGGGSAGHVTPNMALIEVFATEVKMAYIGSKDGIEAELIKKTNIPYYAIHTGKFRRYFSWQNFIDPFKVMMGGMEAYRLLGKIKPDVVFSKGGFVAVPVVLAAYLRKIPVVIHESDMTPGLANRICVRFAKKICVNFPQVAKLIKHKNAIVETGTPVRQFLLHGSPEKALSYTGLASDRPTILVIGGSLGAVRINQALRACLPFLLENHQVIHLCGKGNVDAHLAQTPFYFQLEYAHEHLGDLFALADMAVSRAGANALCELLTLGKPHLLIPLDKGSRGDQKDNASYFEAKGVSRVLDEKNLTAHHLFSEITKTFDKRFELAEKMKAQRRRI
jgi:UDP-N-acetylglucosamine--N-acetylmuramyl-(pentapeptide) pyrophosphoryl-undecaprenol N-acetylglucosamine transferase